MIKNVHNFHLVLNNNLKERIKRFSKELNLSKSKTVIYILNATICVLNKYQYELQEDSENLSYQKIDWNTDLHIYMDKKFYRKIKHLADTVFSFSIAIVVRKLIELYFKILDKNNGRVDKLKRIFKRFFVIYLKKYIAKKEFIKEVKNEQLSGDFYYYIRYNDKFTITGFKFYDSD